MSSASPAASAGQNQPANSGSASPSGSAARTNSGSSSATSSGLIIPQSAPAGGLTITAPPQTATSFYKIAPSQEITFGWNFTDLFSIPQSLTVSAVCDNGNTYPVGPTDGVIAGTATSVVWDPFGYDQSNPNMPLAEATYTLHIWDNRGQNAARAPGLFSPNSALKFALYKPEDYTPLASGWQCTGCSGALSAYTAHPAFAGMIATLVVMFLSGWGIMRRWR